MAGNFRREERSKLWEHAEYDGWFVGYELQEDICNILI